MIKSIKNTQWCDATLDGFCGTDRMAAAKRVCSRKYFSAYNAISQLGTKISLSKQDPSIDREIKIISARDAEKFQTEQELIGIQEARLSLKRRKLKLLHELRKLN